LILAESKNGLRGGAFSRQADFGAGQLFAPFTSAETGDEKKDGGDHSCCHERQQENSSQMLPH
jgi:hypothetical protein